MPLSDADRENLVAYLDGELDEETARSIEARLNTDPILRAEVETLKQAWELLDYLPRSEPSGSFTHRTMERLALHKPISTMRMSRPGGYRQWLTPLCWTAALLLAFGGGFAVARLQGPRFSTGAFPRPVVEQTLHRDLRVLENKHLYDPIDDLPFLENLDHPDLFGQDSF